MSRVLHFYIYWLSNKKIQFSFRFALSDHYYDDPYGPSCTPTQLYFVFKMGLEKFSKCCAKILMSDEVAKCRTKKVQKKTSKTTKKIEFFRSPKGGKIYSLKPIDLMPRNTFREVSRYLNKQKLLRVFFKNRNYQWNFVIPPGWEKLKTFQFTEFYHQEEYNVPPKKLGAGTNMDLSLSI